MHSDHLILSNFKNAEDVRSQLPKRLLYSAGLLGSHPSIKIVVLLFLFCGSETLSSSERCDLN